MSHYRNLGGGRRDKNEPEIMQRFRHHGWHPEQVSGNRQWDLNAYPPKPTTTGTNNRCFTLVCHVDVKGPNGKVEAAQREKWKALSEKGIPVYVVRTEADVDALVRGELEPWRPEAVGVRGGSKPTLVTDTISELDALLGEANMTPYFHVKGCKGPPCACSKRGTPRAAYIPPRSTPVDAAKEAAETFAPCAADPTGQCDCPAHVRNRPTVCEAYACYEPPVGGTHWCREHTL